MDAADDRSAGLEGPVAFVLGGGGRLGAAEVGMLEALVGVGVRPDLVLGTSIGAINGAIFASSPDWHGVHELRELWLGVEESGLLGDGMFDRLRTMVSTGVALHRSSQLAALFADIIDDDQQIEDLAVDFACVAACIETAAATWFQRGPLVPALLASAAVPGLFEPMEVDGRHYLDGGLVDSIPVARAVRCGARTIFVLQVGRIEHPLSVPTNPLRVAQVSFEIARRHGFTTFMEDVPPDVDVHVLPSGGAAPDPADLRANLSYRDASGLATSIADAREASEQYLDANGIGATG
ncbi:patatin-like phospholipase family protein [Salsipaludibacter albus]|uniref:patatin-like phospholipase family protein n=1 Tax=Salsipaludibacter albus TaxID=2849650 RepID=UPI001EE42192|nr:patatin-like phospholipase family protein [Salsipaludibacter albus]MBY5162018.1 patatin-like phospholipase family protein [Salsipaludibacter albus]